MSRRILITIGLVLLGLAGLVMWQNHARATKQVTAIVAADAAGTDQTAQVALLKAYVASHMGSSTTVQLAGAYARAQAAAAAAAQASAANAQIYAEAQRACAGKSDSIVQARCNQEYLAKRLIVVPQSAPVTAPDPASFVYKFSSPIWYPDLAGALVLGGLVALVWAFVGGKRRKRRPF